MIKKPHPLVNKVDSKHYNENVEPGEKTTIEIFEEKYTVRQLHDFSMITEDKYAQRMGRKDDVEKEARKLETYGAYKDMLKEIITKYPSLADLTAKTAYTHLEYDWIY